MSKILLVEDEMFVRELYERVLKQAGFEMITAADGLSGLEKAEEKPNLILLDIMLPGLDGLQVLQRLKQNPNTREIPVVLLTNLGQASIIKQALATGASGYLMKVRISPYQLLSYVKEFIQNPNLKIEPSPNDFD
jgi:two-component system, OmpR family, alkaline phosphatase synthesis response regulator PhoP